MAMADFLTEHVMLERKNEIKTTSIKKNLSTYIIKVCQV